MNRKTLKHAVPLAAGVFIGNAFIVPAIFHRPSGGVAVSLLAAVFVLIIYAVIAYIQDKSAS